MGKETPVRVRIAAVDRLSKTIDKVKSKFPELSRAASRTNTMFGILEKTTEKFNKKMTKIGEGVQSAGKTLSLGITLPALAAAGYSVKKFAEFEDALAEVQGSTNLTSEELKQFGERIQKATKFMPESSEELLKIAGAAGEVGVRGVDDLEKFTLTMAKLGKTANIKGDEAVESIAKIMKLTNEGVGNVDRFGSSITALGDKYGVSAKKVVDSTFEITREISKFGVSSSQAAALAAAVEPLGFNAKQASGAIGDSFRAIDEAIRKGGVQMQGLAAITGMTSQELKKQFGEDATVVFQKFLEGLQKIKQNGGPTADALKFFNISGEKGQVIIEGLAKDTGKLAEIMKTSADAYRENTALSAEYAERTATFSSKMKVFHNNIDVLAEKLGAKLVPFIEIGIDLLTQLMGWFEEHPTIATFAAAVVAVAAALGPLLITLGTFIAFIPKLVAGWSALTAIMAGFGTVTWAATLPILLIIAKFILIGALIAGLIYLIWKFRDAIWKGLVVVFQVLMNPLGSLLKGLGLLTDKVKEFLGFGGANAEMTATQNQNLNTNFQPGGAPITGIEQATKFNPEFMSQTNNARVDINVRAPESTKIVGESENGMLSINRGMAGAF